MAPKRKVAEAEKEVGELKAKLDESGKRLDSAKKKKAVAEEGKKAAEDKAEKTKAEKAKVEEKINDAEKKVKEKEKKSKEKDAKIKQLEVEKGDLEETKQHLVRRQSQLEETLLEAKKGAFFLDISFEKCQFAKPFSYFISLELGGSEVARTELSHCSQFPTFARPNFLVPLPDGADRLHVRAFVVQNGSTKKLGEAQVSLADLLGEGFPCVFKSVDFKRKVARTASWSPKSMPSQDDSTIVGRCELRLEKKVVGSGGVLSPGLAQGDDLEDEPGLEGALWLADPFQHRLRVLVHCAKDIFVDASRGGGSSGSGDSPKENKDWELLVVARTLRVDGSVSFEQTSNPVSLPRSTSGVEHLPVNQELILPLPHAAMLRDQRCQLTLELRPSKRSEFDMSSKELLVLSFFLSAVPAFDSCTVLAAPSAQQTTKKPALCFTLTREIELEELRQGVHGCELRLTGVPITRPLPEAAEGAILVVSSDFPYTGADMPKPQIPLLRYQYDLQRDLTPLLERYYSSPDGRGTSSNHTSGASNKYFLSPAAVLRSRAPAFQSHVVRFAASATDLQRVSAFLFDRGHGRSDPRSPLPEALVGFAAADCSSLVPSTAGGQVTRSFFLDMRLVGDPNLAASLELDARVWGCNHRNSGAENNLPKPPSPPRSEIDEVLSPRQDTMDARELR